MQRLNCIIIVLLVYYILKKDIINRLLAIITLNIDKT